LVELDDIFCEGLSLDKPSIMEFNKVTTHMKVDNPISIKYSPSLAHSPLISPLSSPLPIFILI